MSSLVYLRLTLKIEFMLKACFSLALPLTAHVHYFNNIFERFSRRLRRPRILVVDLTHPYKCDVKYTNWSRLIFLLGVYGKREDDTIASSRVIWRTVLTVEARELGFFARNTKCKHGEVKLGSRKSAR